MSYYDDCDDDDEYSSEDEIFYHNYSVDYANQILGSHHARTSCLPLMRRRHRRCSPRLVRVATLDQMPIVNRHQVVPSLRSRPKYGDEEDISSPIPAAPPPPLPSLEETSEELERRATRTTQPTFEATNVTFSPSVGINNLTPQDTHRSMSEAELRQVQQQQEAFQQHLMNMQRHLLEQQQQQQQQEQRQPQRELPMPTLTPSTSRRLEKRTKISYDLELDDDQAEIAELIETDPYFAAAMEDFAHTHGLLQSHRHRTDSNSSASHYSSKRHRRPPSSLSSSSSSMTSVTDIKSDGQASRSELILLHELHQIRRLMEQYFRDRSTMVSPNRPFMPVPWSIATGQYPSGQPGADYPSSMVPSQRPPPPDPNRVNYQNVVNSVREIMDRRSPSQRDQPLKPSEIDPTLKHVYTKRPQIPSSARRPPLPPPSQQPRRRRSSQMSTPQMLSSIPPAPPLPPSLQQQQQRRRRSSQMSSTSTASSPNPFNSSNIPPAPPYEPLANFTSSRSTINKNRNLAYGNRQKQQNNYDTLRLGYC